MKKLWMPALVIGCLVASGCGKKSKQIAIGTGSETGVYYPTGSALAELFNVDKSKHGYQLSAESTGGSVFNINAVLKGDLEFGLAQSDRQYQAVKGLAEWEQSGPRSKLRAICSLHPEAVTLVAADDAGIRELADLKDKRVNIGNPGSGQRGNAIDVLTTAGIDWKTDIKAEGTVAKESASLLQDGKIDAFFYTVGHPNGSIKEATAGLRRKVHFVPITNMAGLLEKSPYYAEGVIPMSLYPRATNSTDVSTIGVMTTLITSADVPDDVAYNLTKALFENLDQFKGMHEALSRLEAKDMVTKGLSAPLHPGAKKYFKEAGLID